MAKNTRDIILRSFEAMLDRTPFEKITVTSLIQECNISRNTFYYHYENIYALLEDWMLYALGKYEISIDGGDWPEKLKTFLYACQEHKRRIYHVFDSISRDRLERYIFKTAEDELYAYAFKLARGKGIPEQEIRAVTDICRYAIAGFFFRFLWNGMTDDIDASVDALTPVFEGIIKNALHLN